MVESQNRLVNFNKCVNGKDCNLWGKLDIKMIEISTCPIVINIGHPIVGMRSRLCVA